MSSTPSLTSNIRGFKVRPDSGNALFSHSKHHPNAMTCFLHHGMDNTGRQVCANSYVTRTAGCHSATLLTLNENNVSRPNVVHTPLL